MLTKIKFIVKDILCDVRTPRIIPPKRILNTHAFRLRSSQRGISFSGVSSAPYSFVNVLSNPCTTIISFLTTQAIILWITHYGVVSFASYTKRAPVPSLYPRLWRWLETTISPFLLN